MNVFQFLHRLWSPSATTEDKTIEDWTAIDPDREPEKPIEPKISSEEQAIETEKNVLPVLKKTTSKKKKKKRKKRYY